MEKGGERTKEEGGRREEGGKRREQRAASSEQRAASSEQRAASSEQRAARREDWKINKADACVYACQTPASKSVRGSSSESGGGDVGVRQSLGRHRGRAGRLRAAGAAQWPWPLLPAQPPASR